MFQFFWRESDSLQRQILWPPAPAAAHNSFLLRILKNKYIYMIFLCNNCCCCCIDQTTREQIWRYLLNKYFRNKEKL